MKNLSSLLYLTLFYKGTLSKFNTIIVVKVSFVAAIVMIIIHGTLFEKHNKISRASLPNDSKVGISSG